MKKVASLLTVICFTVPAFTAFAESGSKFGVGGRWHRSHSLFTELPFDDGDLAYGLSYEVHESEAYWQVAVTYAPDVTGTNSADTAITPQLSLILKDSYWRGGVGVLSSYITSDDEDDWTDIYWQFILGVHLGASSRSGIDVLAYYPFESWSDLGDFDARDIEFGLWFSFSF